MSTQASGGTGIFAKFVAKFLVKWIKKTLARNRGGEQPALSATPSRLTGAGPERDRSRENNGAHTGSTGPRAAGAAPNVTALQGDDYGRHTGSSGPRAEAPTPNVQAVQGGGYGEHRGVDGQRPTRPAPQAGSQRPSWTDLVRQEVAQRLRQIARAVLEVLGLSDRQHQQAAAGHIPSGHQVSPAGPGQAHLRPASPETQVATNAQHTQAATLAPGQRAELVLPGGARATVVVLQVSQ